MSNYAPSTGDPDDREEGFLDYDPADTSWVNASDALKDLLAQVDLDVKGWRPEPGDKVAGTLVDITEGEGDYGPYPILVIQTPSDELVGVHAFHTVLRKEVEKKIARGSMEVGDLVAIAYRGENDKAKAGMQAANMYRIAVAKQS